jgi:hypothetical protein
MHKVQHKPRKKIS